MSPQKELLEIVEGTKLALETGYDRALKIPNEFNEIRDFHKKNFPNYPLEPEPKAPPAADIFLFAPDKEALHTLNMLASSLSITFRLRTKVSEKEDWEGAKLAISPIPLEGKAHLPPLFLLNEPQQKRALWKELCLKIAGLKLPKSF